MEKIKNIINDVNASGILGDKTLDTTIYRQSYTDGVKKITTREICTADGEMITDARNGLVSKGKLIKYNNIFFNCYNINNGDNNFVVTNKANVSTIAAKAKAQIEYNYNSCDIAADKDHPSERILKNRSSKFNSLVDFASHYCAYNAISTSRDRSTRECYVIDIDYDCDVIKSTINSIMKELKKRNIVPSCIQKHLTNNHIQFFWFFDEPKSFKKFENNDIGHMAACMRDLADGLYEYVDFTLLTKGDEEITASGAEYKSVYLQLGHIFNNLFDKNFKGWKMKNPFFKSPDFETIFFSRSGKKINISDCSDVITYKFDDVKNSLSDIVINTPDTKVTLETSEEDFISNENVDLGRNDTVLIESRRICHKNILSCMKRKGLKDQKMMSTDDINELRAKCYDEAYKTLFYQVSKETFKGTRKKGAYTKNEFDSTFNCSFDYVYNNFSLSKIGKSKYSESDVRRASTERRNENTIKFIRAFKYLNSIRKRSTMSKAEKNVVIKNVMSITHLSRPCVSYFIKNKFMKLSRTEFQKMFNLATEDYVKRRGQLKRADSINDIWCMRLYDHQNSGIIKDIYDKSLHNKDVKQKRLLRMNVDESLITSVSVDYTDYSNNGLYAEATVDGTVNIIEPPPNN